MSALFRKETPLDRQKRKVEKELSLVNSDIRYLSKILEKPGKPADLSMLKSAKPRPEPGPALPPPVAEPPAHEDAKPRAEAEESPRGVQQRARIYDERFSDYLATNLQSGPPLRNEKRLQRNKAIMMIIFFLVILLLVLCRFLS